MNTWKNVWCLGLCTALCVSCFTFIDVDPIDLHTVSALGPHSVELSWKVPAGYEGSIDSYIIRRYRDGQFAQTFTITTSESTYTDEALEGDSRYEYTIEPIIHGYYSTVESNRKGAQTHDDPLQTLSIPGAFSAMLVSDDPRRMELSWNPVADANAYELLVYSNERYEETIELEGVSTLRLNSLLYGNNWGFTIRAINKTDGSYSKTSAAITCEMPYLYLDHVQKATPLIPSINEYFYFETSNQDKPLWGFFVPSGDEFSVQVNRSNIIYRVYKKLPDGSFELVAAAEGSENSDDPPVFSGFDGEPCYISFHLSSKQSPSEFTVRIEEGE